MNRAVIPSPDASWQEVIEFAHTHNGYERFGRNPLTSTGSSDISDFANSTMENWERSGTLPNTIDELRCALFFEGRRSRMGFDFDFDPAQEWMNPRREYLTWITYLKALIEEIRHLNGSETTLPSD